MPDIEARPLWATRVGPVMVALVLIRHRRWPVAQVRMFARLT
jgi:hypothetical protein